MSRSESSTGRGYNAAPNSPGDSCHADVAAPYRHVMDPLTPATSRTTARSDDALLADFHTVLRRILEELPGADGGRRLSDALQEHLGVEPHLLAVVGAPVPAHRLVDADIALSEVMAADPDATIIGIAGDARHHMSLGDLVQRFHGPGHGGRPGRLRPDADRARQGRPAAGRDLRHPALPLRGAPGRGPPAGHEPAVRPRGRAPSRSSSQDRDVSDALMARVQRAHGRAQRHPRTGRDLRRRPLRPGPGRRDLLRAPHGRRGRGRAARRRARPGRRTTSSAWASSASASSPTASTSSAASCSTARPAPGKTHTVRYLLSATPGTTAVLLSGGSLRFIHDAAKVARAHQPAIVVLEDCDLVAEDRSFGRWGLAAALRGARRPRRPRRRRRRGLRPHDEPGRGPRGRPVAAARAASTSPPRSRCPTREGRRELLRLYGGHLFGAEAISAAAARAEGTTASFAKELVRRAVLAAALADEPPADDHLGLALDELLSDAQRAHPQPPRRRVA